jgi:hypothetical protein
VPDAATAPIPPEAAAAVRAELEAILASPALASTERLRRFLRYLVEQTLAGRAAELKEYAIGLDVFDRDAGYDPRVDSTVRVHAGKLRDRLREYYLSAGKESPVRIEVPKGTFVPVFTFPAAPGPQNAPRPASRRGLLVAAIAVAAAGIAAGAIWRAAGTPPALQFSPVTFRRGMISAARFGPDGQTVVYTAAWEGKPLELFLTRPGMPDSRSLDLPGTHLLATGPNGEMAVGVGARYRSFFQFGGTLALASLSGGMPRELLADTSAADIGPDGTLAVVRRVSGRDRVEWPPGRVVFEGPPAGWIGDLRISHDGIRIAFLVHPVIGDNLGSLYVADRQGSARRLGEEWPGVQGTAWGPGGREIWFAVSPSATDHALYAVGLSGRRRTVWNGPETFVLHDVSASGRVLLSLENVRLHVIAQPAGETAERDVSWLDGGCSCGLSQDGKSLLIGEAGVGGGPRESVYLRTLAAASAVRLGDGIPIALSPDGAWALAFRHDSPQHPVFLPAGVGSARDIAAGGIRFQERGSWLPDSRRVLLVGRAADRPPRTYIVPLDGGAPQPLTPEGATGVLLSPDGGRLLVRNDAGKWMIFRMEDGGMTPVQGLSGLGPVGWSETANVVYARGGDMPARIYRVNLQSGAREEWRRLMPLDPAGAMAIQHVQVTPSGNAMAYTYFQFDAKLFVADGLR